VAIVTPDPGTTRDAVGAWVMLDGEHFKLVDTAGDWAGASGSLADREAARVTRQRVEGADLLVWVMDAAADLERDVPKPGALLIMNKADLLEPNERAEIEARLAPSGGLVVSALTGQGTERLGSEIAKRLRSRLGPSDGVILDERQAQALGNALDGCRAAAKRLEEGHPELAATDLSAAYQELVWVTGESRDPELFERIFSRFCIGK
jgi:tRNA modification GTPase